MLRTHTSILVIRSNGQSYATYGGGISIPIRDKRLESCELITYVCVGKDALLFQDLALYSVVFWQVMFLIEVAPIVIRIG